MWVYSTISSNSWSIYDVKNSHLVIEIITIRLVFEWYQTTKFLCVLIGSSMCQWLYFVPPKWQNIYIYLLQHNTYSNIVFSSISNVIAIF